MYLHPRYWPLCALACAYFFVTYVLGVVERARDSLRYRGLRGLIRRRTG